MMKRLMVVVMTAVMTVLGSAAMAFAEDGAFGDTYCVSWDGDTFHRKHGCAEFRWSKQSDGDGVRAEFLNYDTEEGCGNITGGHGNSIAYNKAAWDWVTPDSKQTWYAGDNWGDEPCDFTKNHDSVPGKDTGPMDYWLRLCESNGNDRLWWRIRLRPNGESDIVQKGHAQTDLCNGTSSRQMMRAVDTPVS